MQRWSRVWSMPLSIKRDETLRHKTIRDSAQCNVITFDGLDQFDSNWLIWLEKTKRETRTRTRRWDEMVSGQSSTDNMYERNLTRLETSNRWWSGTVCVNISDHGYVTWWVICAEKRDLHLWSMCDDHNQCQSFPSSINRTPSTIHSEDAKI